MDGVVGRVGRGCVLWKRGSTLPGLDGDLESLQVVYDGDKQPLIDVSSVDALSGTTSWERGIRGSAEGLDQVVFEEQVQRSVLKNCWAPPRESREVPYHLQPWLILHVDRAAGAFKSSSYTNG